MALKTKHAIISDIRGKGLPLGIELVSDRASKTPMDENVSIQVAVHCMTHGLIIGRTNRSLKSFNNTLSLCPMLTLNQEEADFILSTLDIIFTTLKNTQSVNP